MTTRGLWLTFLGLFLIGIGTAKADGAAARCRFTPMEARGAPSAALRRLVSQGNLYDQRGLGGTGVIAQSQERGVGGTGIVGIVTGFGSVCVDGYEVEIDHTAQVMLEGLPAKRADIQLGQLVEVEAYPHANRLVASHVAIRIVVAGPIQTISADRKTLEVAAQKIEVANFGGSADVEHLLRGDWIAVSGLRQTNGTILGTSVVRLHIHGSEVVVAGRPELATDGTLHIGGLTVRGGNLQAGQSVLVRGEPQANVLTVMETRPEAAAFSRGVQKFAIQAEGPMLEAELSRVTGTTVRLNSDLFRQTAQPGIPLQAEGRITSGTAVAVDRVTSPRPPLDALHPAVSQSLGSLLGGRPGADTGPATPRPPNADGNPPDTDERPARPDPPRPGPTRPEMPAPPPPPRR